MEYTHLSRPLTDYALPIGTYFQYEDYSVKFLEIIYQCHMIPE